MRVGPYELLGEIGRGGMGVVYRARSGGEDVALKLLARVDADRLARFERERRLLGSLGEEQGFVGLLDAGSHDGTPWIVMPFVPGGTLRERLASGPLPVAETTRILLELARALGAAHALGIVHRDLKPENILFTAQGRPLVADLGLAKHFDRSARGGSQSLSLSHQGGLRGTVGYMAPEQIADARSVGPTADVFALGAIGYECLAGRPAFAAENIVELMAAVTAAKLDPIDPAAAPAWLRAVVARALAADPRVRFPDGAALARALAGSKEPGERGKGPVFAVAGLVVLLLLLAGAVLLRPAPRPPAAAPPGPTRPKAPTVKELLALARERERKGDMDGSLDYLVRVLELDPLNAEAIYRRGVVKVNKGDALGAIEDATRAVELDPRLSEALVLRALTHQQRGEMDEALADFSKAIDMDPGNPGHWITRAAFFGAKGDMDRAIADSDRAIELEPANAKAWANRGRAHNRKRDWTGASEDWSKVVELTPEDPEGWRSRAYSRVMLKDYEPAIADFTRALELVPDDRESCRVRGAARESSGDKEGAIRDYERYLELAPAGEREVASVRRSLEALKAAR